MNTITKRKKSCHRGNDRWQKRSGKTKEEGLETELLGKKTVMLCILSRNVNVCLLTVYVLTSLLYDTTDRAIPSGSVARSSYAGEAATRQETRNPLGFVCLYPFSK